MYGHDVLGSRNNTSEHTLTAKNVNQLGLKWNFPGSTFSTPTVVNHVVYASNGTSVVALNESNGKQKWSFNVGAVVSDSILISGQTAIFGDWNGDVWGVNIKDGTKKWQIHPNTQGGPLVAVYGSATPVGKFVAIGIASNEEQDKVTTFSANGSVVMIDPTNGNVVWQTYTIPQAAYDADWRGASVWSTPTFDKTTNMLYVTTGNYFQSGTGTDPGVEDGVIALDATTGTIKWTNQLVFGDVWNGNIVPGPNNPDADIGDSAKLMVLPDGKKAVGVGSKDGFYFVMDAATGAPINGPNGLQLEVGGVLGGLFATGGVDQKDGIEFSNGNNWPTLLQPGDTGPVGGDLYAVSLDGKTMLWDFKTPSPAVSGIAIANGMVFFKTFDGMVYVLDAKAPDADHALLASFNVGSGFSGVAVADGQFFTGGGGISAYALPPKVVTKVTPHVGGFAGGLTASALTLAGGGLTTAQINGAVNSFINSFKPVVGDIAAIAQIKAPSLKALGVDYKAYAVALNANDLQGAQAALAKVKTDLTALFAALATQEVNLITLGSDEATLYADLDTLLADQQQHDLTKTSADASVVFSSFLTVFNDLLAGRYGLKL
jgi:outer membrane protein assembly factor BamB